MEPVFRLEEALRYLGAGGQAPEELLAEVRETAAALCAALRPRYTWRVFPVARTAAGAALEGTELVLTGRTAETMLSQCRQAVLLACTLGADFDRMLLSAQARDMARAVVLDACGSAWTEAGCDAAEAEIGARFPELYRTDRFSPGYGDLPLSLQAPLCALLDTRRRLGVTVTDSFLLTPAKTVTAVLGLSDRPQAARVRGCAFCALREHCAMRRGGRENAACGAG